MKHRAGKGPLPDADRRALPQMLARQGGTVAPYAAAMDLGCPPISRDGAFDGLDGRPGWPGRI